MKVLARHVPVIETLGSATVLCVDKTGTLTVNRMSIHKLAVNGKVFEVDQSAAEGLPEEVHEIVEFGILASQRDPFDPMEKAFHDLGNSRLEKTEHLHADWSLERGYPLSPSLLAMSHVWKSPTGKDYVLAAKGAPEAIADLCHLDADRTMKIGEDVAAMALDGLRVLGVARGRFSNLTLPGEQHDFMFEFLGLVGLADPIRATVPAAVEECYTAGIRVVMITGDHPATAKSIAMQAGIRPVNEIMTGADLEQLEDAQLQQRVRAVNVFARMVPEQKLRLVNALKSNGEIVAMTGDGVNDAPALKAAHIGIAAAWRCLATPSSSGPMATILRRLTAAAPMCSMPQRARGLRRCSIPPQQMVTCLATAWRCRVVWSLSGLCLTTPERATAAALMCSTVQRALLLRRWPLPRRQVATTLATA